STKIKNFFIIPFFSFGLLLLAFFVLSIYYKHFFTKEEGNIEKVVNHRSVEPKAISVIIYNATGVNGLAKELKLYLKTFQVDKIAVENYKEFRQESMISSKPEKIEYAKYIATLLDYNLDFIQISDTIDRDILIIIGKDYRLLKPFRN
ncbi:MAG: LytR C-terminal domain-containing protein, partial [Candidatus Kapaibacteriota bacterium]